MEYNHYNKIKKVNEKLNMFIIMTKNMILEIKNKDIYQFFGDATYRCTPPTFRGYKLYVISGFNLCLKRSRILAYILIPNETFTTYTILFYKLKNDFGFNPKIYNLDFNRASSKAVKSNFPNIYLVKCFYHFVQAIWKNLKQYGLTKKEYIKETIELSYNIKLLCFVDPNNIYSIYQKIQKKYNNSRYKDFLSYFNRTWNPKGKTK